MISDNALQHQIVLPQQRSFYEYWRTKCREGRLPSRSDIDPGEMGPHLSMVSLTEKKQGRFCFRLAGTGFWRFYGREIQGRFLDELPIGCRTDYWARVLDMVIDQARPFHGVTKPNTPMGSHMAQFWMRLPLADDGHNVDMILGYDHFAPLEEIALTEPVREKVYA